LSLKVNYYLALGAVFLLVAIDLLGLVEAIFFLPEDVELGATTLPLLIELEKFFGIIRYLQLNDPVA
jgi:hypothetical protein